MRTRSAVLRAAGAPTPYATSRPLGIEDVELAPPGEGEVLVAVKAAGLCHSDLSVVNGDRPRPTPMALGHEAAGEVLEVGVGVRDVTRRRPRRHGVRAVVRAVRAVPRGPARAVRAGRGQQHRRHAALRRAPHHRRRRRRRSTTTSAARRSPSSRSCSERSLVKIDDDLPWDQAALFGCAVLTGVGAVVNTAQVRLGQSVAVVGLGGVGLNALLAALASGARDVVAVDTLAGQARPRPRPRRDPHRARRTRTPPTRSATSPAAASTSPSRWPARCTRSRRPTARRVAAARPSPAACRNPAAMWRVSPVHLVAEERTIKGSYIGSAVPRSRHPALRRAVPRRSPAGRQAARRRTSRSTTSTPRSTTSTPGTRCARW